MGDPLHDRQSVNVLANARQVIEIAGNIEGFPRVAESVENDLATLPAGARPGNWRAQPITGRVRFGHAPDGSGDPALEGEVLAQVPAVCQRCLEPFRYALDVPVAVQFGREANKALDAAVSPGYEYWELPDDRVRPVDIVDELIVMAMPLSARHANDEDCRAPEEAGAASDRTRPFADLRRQMENADKE